MTPNYLRSPKISVSPYCDCTNSGNNKDDCDKFTEFFRENTCLRKFSVFESWLFLMMVYYFHPLCWSLSCSAPLIFFLFPFLQTKFIPLQRLRYYPTELQRNQHCCTAVSDCECIVFLVCCLCALKLLLNCSHGFPQTKKAFYVTVFIHKVILFLGKKSRNSWKTIFLYVFLSKQLVLI